MRCLLRWCAIFLRLHKAVDAVLSILHEFRDKDSSSLLHGHTAVCCEAWPSDTRQAFETRSTGVVQDLVLNVCCVVVPFAILF